MREKMKSMKQKHVEEKEIQEVDRTSIEALEKCLNRVVEECSNKIDSLKSASSLAREKKYSKEEIAIS